jgi:DNA repair protein RadC
MNEYTRLARMKDVTARSLAELLAAAYDFDEEKANQWAIKLGDLSADALGDGLPRKSANSRELARMLQELTRRSNADGIIREGLPTLVSVNDITAQCLDIRDKKKEFLLAFFLNARLQLICKEVISIGTLTASLAHPREIFSPAIGKAAAGIILVHNHPSGDPSPSDEDMRVTKRIAQAGQILGINLVEHLIVSERGTFSFKATGQL